MVFSSEGNAIVHGILSRLLDVVALGRGRIGLGDVKKYEHLTYHI